MATLLDIAPSFEEVEVAGKRIRVVGVSLAGVAHLLTRFPEMGDMLNGKSVTLTVEMLIEKVPDAIASIIAAGTGSMGNEAVEERAALLPLEDQVQLLEAIVKMTLPKGIGPFVEALQRLGAQFGVSDLGTKVRASNSPKPPKR